MSFIPCRCAVASRLTLRSTALAGASRSVWRRRTCLPAHCLQLVAPATQPSCQPPIAIVAGKPLDLEKEDLRKRQESQ